MMPLLLNDFKIHLPCSFGSDTVQMRHICNMLLVIYKPSANRVWVWNSMPARLDCIELAIPRTARTNWIVAS